MSNTGPTGLELLKGKKCTSCGSPAVARNGFIAGVGDNIKYYCCHQCGCQWNSLQYPNYEGPSLKERFAAVVEEYLAAFCKKQGFDRFDGYWIGDRVGEVFEIADMFFGFDDIRYDVDSNQPDGLIIKWYLAGVDNVLDKPFPDPFPNYDNWCKMNTNTKEEKC